ncbi:MAG: amidohydrolase [Candidatus Eremiobacteraeota bacterium]|nr:amidohydrolase [Candidatus Eremiobacteraeota bacterium]
MNGAADLIVTAASVYRVDGGAARAEAFAIRNGRFVFVGAAQDAMSLRGPRTQVLELGGRSVLPGIVDAHLHLTNLGLKLEQVELDGVDSVDELIGKSTAYAAVAEGRWILGRGWDENRWAKPVFPTHRGLSAAIPDRPVALARVDGHAVLANACAMRIAGIDASTPDPPGGRILRDAAGEPTGLFVDAAEALIYNEVPKPSHEALVRATRAAVAHCNRWGITAVAEPGCGEDVLTAHRELIDRGEYSIRNHAMIHDEPSLLERYLANCAAERAHGGRLSVRAIKLYADGALGSRGAALLAPYSDDPTNAGLILASRERIERVAEEAARAGFQVCVHAIGDRANRMVLDAFAAVSRRTSAREARPRIEHAQVLAPDDVPRFAELGVIASMQAAHALSDLKWAQSRLGAERLRGAYAWRALLDRGTIIANGTDAPVEPASPTRNFFASIAGQSDSTRCMTRTEALASMTANAAYANLQEREIGSIAPGKYADFVVVDRDWMTIPSDEIEGTKIVATYFEGRRVYDGGEG